MSRGHVWHVSLGGMSTKCSSLISLLSVIGAKDHRHRWRLHDRRDEALTSPLVPCRPRKSPNVKGQTLLSHSNNALNLRCRIYGMLARSCLLRRLQPPCSRQPTPSALLQRTFHQTAYPRASHMPNHYETLDLPTHATPAEIKK